MKLSITFLFTALGIITSYAGPILNGVPIFDDRDSTVNAHGANIIKDGEVYYLFGEYKTDSANVFQGFSCYSSPNLSDWKFEGIALPMQPDGRLGPNRVGERPKVFRAKETGEYVMIAHSDNRLYKDPCVVYATSPTINGVYTFRGPLLYKERPIKRWDLGCFTDDDGTSYLLMHHGDIYRISPDGHSLDSCMTHQQPGVGESPAMFKHNGVYYWLSSHTTSWERNDNMYFTSASLSGPWQYRGCFCPEGSLTHNSQTSYVLPLVSERDTTYMYMGDRWSFPRQRSAATYVWLPITLRNGEMSITEYYEAWRPESLKKTTIVGKSICGEWISSQAGDSLSVSFNGCGHLVIRGNTDAESGYATIKIFDEEGKILHNHNVDFYSKNPSRGIRYYSPYLPKGEYRVEVGVAGFSPVWTDKTKRVFGSSGFKVYVSEIMIAQ